jgi:hypothetical protein
MKRTGQAKVAVLGASGIGKHHANWWNMEGADVCAFLGSTPESVEATAGKLSSMFGFQGRGYTDLAALLETEAPDIVDVCTPPEMHFAHARQALEANCHVLCEKPFVYDRKLADEVMIGEARELVEFAATKNRQFGVCTQYVLSGRECFRLWREQRPDTPLDAFTGYLVSPIRGRAPDASRTWVDLAPHMLGALRAIEPQGDIDWDSLQLDFEHHRGRARFSFVRPDSTAVTCDIHTDHRDTEPKNVRQMTFNDDLFDIGGFNDENGVFQSEIRSPWGTTERPDFMRLLIRDFLGGKVDVTGPMGLRNLDWMLTVLAAVRRKGEG